MKKSKSFRAKIIIHHREVLVKYHQLNARVRRIIHSQDIELQF